MDSPVPTIFLSLALCYSGANSADGSVLICNPDYSRPPGSSHFHSPPHWWSWICVHLNTHFTNTMECLCWAMGIPRSMKIDTTPVLWRSSNRKEWPNDPVFCVLVNNDEVRELPLGKELRARTTREALTKAASTSSTTCPGTWGQTQEFD